MNRFGSLQEREATTNHDPDHPENLDGYERDHDGSDQHGALSQVGCDEPASGAAPARGSPIRTHEGSRGGGWRSRRDTAMALPVRVGVGDTNSCGRGDSKEA